MVILYLNEKKILHAIKRACNYQGENAFETLRIISANTISGHALNDCIVECHIINPNGEGDIVQLNFNDTTPDGEPTCDILLGNKYTAVNGELTVFLKLFCDNDVIGLTNEVTIKIREHQAVTSYMSEGQRSNHKNKRTSGGNQLYVRGSAYFTRSVFTDVPRSRGDNRKRC